MSYFTVNKNSFFHYAPWFVITGIKERLFIFHVLPLSLSVLCLVAQLCPALSDPVDYSLPGSSVRGDSLGNNTGVGCLPASRESSQTRNRIQVSHIASRFFTDWATRQAQEYCMGSLSLLQRIFPTQKLNWGLLNCRQIPYQLSYQGSPISG